MHTHVKKIIITDVKELTIGSYISFEFDNWDNSGTHSMIIIKSKILDFIIDPSGRHETKCLVLVNEGHCGIPLSEIIEITQPIGSQMLLF